MSSSGRRWRISDDEMRQLVCKLRQLVPELTNYNRRSDNKAVSARKVLEETCNYLKKLHGEVDDLSRRLSDLLATLDDDSDEASIVRTLL